MSNVSEVIKVPGVFVGQPQLQINAARGGEVGVFVAAHDLNGNVVFGPAGVQIAISSAGTQKLAEELSARAALIDKRLDLFEQSGLIARALNVYLDQLNRVRVIEDRVLTRPASEALREEADIARDLRDQLNGTTR